METIKFCSGTGQHHTNEPDSKNLKKKLTAYNEIPWHDVLAIIDKTQSVNKPYAQWLIPSTVLSRNFALQETDGKFCLLWADLDKNPKELTIVYMVLISIIGKCQFEIYTSKSATKINQKARILIILDAPLNGIDWILCQQALNDALEAQGITPDRASERTAQLCYLPNRGKFYDTLHNRDGAFFNPLVTFSKEIEEKKLAIVSAEKEIQKRRAKAEQRKAELKYTGGERNNLIDAFNDSYAIADILIKAGYSQRGNSFCHPNSASGSYSASIDPTTGRINSLSTTDPLYSNGKGAHDAFSAFTVLFHGGE